MTNVGGQARTQTKMKGVNGTLKIKISIRPGPSWKNSTLLRFVAFTRWSKNIFSAFYRIGKEKDGKKNHSNALQHQQLDSKHGKSPKSLPIHSKPSKNYPLTPPFPSAYDRY